ncbi:MAG: hypothetical protein U0230_28100 [Polyangiales bacterium]
MRGRSFAWAVLALVLGTVGAAHAQNQVVGEIPATPVVDEGFAFYTVEHQSLSGSEPPASEWWLKADFRVVGNVPPRSVLYYILKKGSQSLGEVRCDTRSTYSTVGRPTNFPHVFVQACARRDLRVREAGEFQVEWHLLDGNTDQDRTLVTHTIVVRSAPRFDVGSQRPWYPVFYVDRHGELLSSVLYQHPNGFHRYQEESVQVEPGATLDLFFNASPTWGANSLSWAGAFMRCRVDGQPVDLRTPWRNGNRSGTRTDAVNVTEASSTMGEEMVPNPSGNPRYDMQQYLFRRLYVVLPLSFGPPGAQGVRDDATTVGDHPGAWECDLRTSDARTVRTFRFQVGSDGFLVPHAEQTEGGLTLAPGAVFVETVIPEGNPLDLRTDPSAPARLAFSGRGLRSAPAQAETRTIPAVGQAAPRGAGGRGNSRAARGGRGR